MDALAPFRIPAAALKADQATYQWSLGSDFLALFDEEHEGITGQFTVQLDLDRSGGFNTADFRIMGQVKTTCDRCAVPIDLPVESDYQVMIKHGNPDESTDEVIFIEEDAPVFQVGKIIYDFVMLSVPISHRIPGCDQMENAPCDFSILNYLNQHQPEEEKGNDDDSPWQDLKNIVDN